MKAQRLLKAPAVYTLTNLHPVGERRVLSPLNKLSDVLLPVCTRVRVTELNTGKMLFTAGGKEYVFKYHSSAVNGFNDAILRYFGEDCHRAGMGYLSSADQQGIKKGVVARGMSREGVIRAIGYPPAHKTPSLKSNSWTYWRKGQGKFRVIFKDDLVSAILSR